MPTLDHYAPNRPGSSSAEGHCALVTTKPTFLTFSGKSRRAVPAAAVVVAIVFATVPADFAGAQEQGIFIGISGLVTQLGASIDKTVDTRAPDTLVPEPRRGQLLQEKDSDDATAYGTGYLIGYRYLVPSSRLFLDFEVEAAYDSEAAQGQFSGIGESLGRNQLGEFWPDRWEYDADRNYAVTVRLGFTTGLFRAGNTSFYVLGGLRRIDGTFTTRFNGCLDPMPCSTAANTPNFVTGASSRAVELEGMTLGIGVERRIIERMPLRLELRRTDYDDENWVEPFTDVGVTVPTVVGADQTGLSLSLSWTF